MAEPWPTELKLDKEKRVLTVSFDDGTHFALPAELLRVLSPSAEVQGHSEDQRVTVGGKRNVGILRLEPVGNYAVRIAFDDGHDTGFFPGFICTSSGSSRTRAGRLTSPTSPQRAWPASRASLHFASRASSARFRSTPPR